jgi:PPK2 family polyphosphate:nucleotide phosphotransferase
MFDFNYLAPKAGSSIRLQDYACNYTGDYTKSTAKKALKANTKELKEIQRKFYADDRYSLLIVLQAPDAAGKDGTIRHVLGGLNPQGCRVHSFKKPSSRELQHDFLWRHYKVLPERGMIGIFNRSHYENVLIAKVRPEIVLNEKIPGIDSLDKITEEFWQKRYRQINDFERHISENGTIVLKFFLNLSKEEQKERLMARLDRPDKNWKFSSNDLKERKLFEKYQSAYEDMINATNTEYAPWFIIPADHKWFSRIAVGALIHRYLKNIDLQFPEGEGKEALALARRALENEK